MSVCPGCGRCRTCGQPAPYRPSPWYGQPYQPYWAYSPAYSPAYPTWQWTVQSGTTVQQGVHQINLNQQEAQSDQAL